MKVNSVILDENCLVIGISVSGQTDDIISSLKLHISTGAYTLLIPQDRTNPIRTSAMRRSSSQAWNIWNMEISFPHSSPFSLVLDVLYAHYLQIDRSKKEALHEYTIQTLQPFLIK